MIELVTGFPKIVRGGSFDFGTAEPLMSIVDDPAVFRKTASSSVVAQWGDVAPIKDHTLVHLIALGDYESTGPNRNGDAFKRAFCQEIHPTFRTHGALYEGHRIKGENVKKGFVVKTAHNDDMGRTEVLVAAAHDKCAHWLDPLEKGVPQAFSMGFHCPYDICSICNHKAASPKFYCEHVKKNASYPFGMNRVLADGQRCHVFNPEGHFNDISHVGTGADMIAFDLRKVAAAAGQHDEVLSGADLGDLYFKRAASFSQSRAELLNRAAAVEGICIGNGVCMTPVEFSHAKVADYAQTPGDMFGGLAALGVILPMEGFFKAALGQDYGELESDIKAAALGQSGAFCAINGDPDATNRVCSNASYDPPGRFYFPVPHEKRADLVREYGVQPAVVDARAIDASIKIASMGDSLTTYTQLTPTQQALTEEYVAYKLAAFDSMALPWRQEIGFDVVMPLLGH